MSPLPITTTNPSTVHAPVRTYSHIAAATVPANSTLITFSGQVGKTPTGTIPADFISQMQTALSNLGACLEECDLGPESIMKVTQYIVGPENASDPRRADLYLAFMGGHVPASTLVGVAFLAEKELLYEIEALAIKEGM